MERSYDARSLLKYSDAYAYTERISEAYKLLLSTDPLDLVLQDRLDAVLEERGIELYTDEYDKEIGLLQDKYLIGRNGFVASEEMSFAQGVGQPCGGSHISASYTCRIGVGPDFSKASAEEAEGLKKKYEAFKTSIANYPPEAQKVFEKEVNGSIDELNGEGRTKMSDAKIVKSYDRVLTNAKIMADDGPPTSIVDKAGNQVEINDKLQPVISRQGGMAWKDPMTNTSYTKRSAGQMELVQNRQQLADDLKNGRVEAGIKHYEKWKNDPALQAKGAFGSAESAKLREPSQKEIDKEWSKLSPDQKSRVATSGLDAVGGRVGGDGKIDARTAHRQFFNDNPDQMERRGKDVMANYLSQSPKPGAKALSAFTGKEIDLPGTYGPKKSTVDHYQALSSFYGKPEPKGIWNREQGLGITLQADSRKNMVLVEAGLNQSKGKREDWNAITKSWQRQVDGQAKVSKRVEKMPSFTSGAKGPSAPVKKTKTKVSNVSGSASIKKTTAKQKSPPKAKAAPKAAPPSKSKPKVSAEQRTAFIKNQQEALKKAKADKRSGDIARLEATLRQLGA